MSTVLCPAVAAPSKPSIADKSPRLGGSPRVRQSVALLALGLLLTLGNAFKTVHIDDAAYVLYAAHIAQHPLAPSDFDVYWDYHWQPANQVLAPPLVPYWIAGAMVCLGDDP